MKRKILRNEPQQCKESDCKIHEEIRANHMKTITRFTTRRERKRGPDLENVKAHMPIGKTTFESRLLVRHQVVENAKISSKKFNKDPS